MKKVGIADHSLVQCSISKEGYLKKMIIAICGMDGSGKTTLARALVDDLRARDIPATMFHGHKYTVSSNSLGLEPSQVRKYRNLWKLLLPVAYADNIYTFFCKYRPMAKSSVLVLDRFFYDKVARMLYFGICGKCLAKFYAWSLPRPEKVFFLDVPEDLAGQRKEEYTQQEFHKFREAYLYLASVLQVAVIDTSSSLERSSSEIIQSVKYYEKEHQ